jgi:hypothetical protein
MGSSRYFLPHELEAPFGPDAAADRVDVSALRDGVAYRRALRLD